MTTVTEAQQIVDASEKLDRATHVLRKLDKRREDDGPMKFGLESSEAVGLLNDVRDAIGMKPGWRGATEEPDELDVMIHDGLRSRLTALIENQREALDTLTAR